MLESLDAFTMFTTRMHWYVWIFGAVWHWPIAELKESRFSKPDINQHLHLRLHSRLASSQHRPGYIRQNFGLMSNYFTCTIWYWFEIVLTVSMMYHIVSQKSSSITNCNQTEVMKFWKYNFISSHLNIWNFSPECPRILIKILERPDPLNTERVFFSLFSLRRLILYCGISASLLSA